ncbi:hypothetical protein GCM10023185_29670 [Hymenobacter saemangeumensis]|uniref:Lipocalin-like domain-containing protein n=1 Tax=Hymenobacter saemangeumensis TaxID=1084522 RepID=A0ABP8IL44_9BACT
MKNILLFLVSVLLLGGCTTAGNDDPTPTTSTPTIQGRWVLVDTRVLTVNTATTAVVSNQVTPHTDYVYNFTATQRQPYVNGIINTSGSIPITTWADSIQLGASSPLRLNRYKVRVLTASDMQFERRGTSGSNTITVTENYRR